MNNRVRLLVVEDDLTAAELLCAALRREGYEVVHESDGTRALELWGSGRNFDLALIDLSLPGLGGLDLCDAIRSNSAIPIVIMTGRVDPYDAVIGLEMGADDYVRKPFDLTELKARIRALLRRAHRDGNSEIIELGPLVVDPQAGRVTKGGREVALSVIELKLLFELAKNAGKVLGRDSLVSRVWGYEYLGNSRLVDMAVKRLRQKIEDDPADPTLIVTVRGLGYRLDPSST